MPWNAILPQLPSVTDLILNLLTNIPKIVERLTKIVEFKEYEQVIINSILSVSSSSACRIDCLLHILSEHSIRYQLLLLPTA